MPDLPDGVVAGALSGTSAAIVVSSATGIRYANQAFATLVGVPAPDLLGVGLDSLARADARPALSAVLDEVLSRRASERTHEAWLRSSETESIATEHTCRQFEVEGQLLAVSTFVETGGPSRGAAANDEADGRLVATLDWRLIDCNGAFAAMFGYDDIAGLVGRSLLEMTPDGPILQKALAVARSGRRTGRVELKMERGDGTPIDVSILVECPPGPGGTTLRGHVIEITERKRLESRLQGAERMEVIGRLAGGLAHDFNNLLTVIRGNSERLLAAMVEGDPHRGAVSAIDKAASRAASLTQQLLAYSRRQVFELRPLSLQTLIADLQPLVAEILGDHIRVQVLLPSELPEISADPRQIEHVIANLALNARESMPSGGSFMMTVDTMDVGESAPRDRGWLRQGRYVRLTVADTGGGMDPVTKAYAFQPFFTTKRMGDGHGLGLATVYGIVKQSHGFVWVDSEVGQGARFTLLFPVIKSSRLDQSLPGSPGSLETVLVVEADTATRAFVAGALRRRGHEVLEAASGAEAVDTFTSHPSRVHLVVFDSRAVTGQGVPLAARLQAIDPLVQSLVMLATPDSAASGRHVLPTTPIIQKPFTLQALADRVRGVLDSGEGRG